MANDDDELSYPHEFRLHIKHSPRQNSKLVRSQQLSSPLLMKILIVDDDPSIRSLLLNVLEEKHEVSLLCNGHNAIAVLSDPNHGFDFTIMDYKMPRLDGEQVLELLSAWENLKTKFILISGYPLNKEKFNSPHLIGSLTKPFSVKELVSLIEEHSGEPVQEN